MSGFIGIYGPKESDVASRSTRGCSPVQHRGQDAAGITTFTDSFHVKKGLGPGARRVQRENMPRLRGSLGVGHVRYPVGAAPTRTCSPSTWCFVRRRHGAQRECQRISSS
ncbi:MAG: hypothetical protein IPK67_19220 [Planctomycetes bacterium]|nr:hypothetical protein [Planctomycetota bacterium]